jgi:hypothetical protein
VVSEDFYDHARVDALGRDQGRAGVAEVVEADPADPGTLAQRGERAVELRGSIGVPWSW